MRAADAGSAIFIMLNYNIRRLLISNNAKFINLKVLLQHKVCADLPSAPNSDGAYSACCNSNRLFWEYGCQSTIKIMLAYVG